MNTRKMKFTPIWLILLCLAAAVSAQTSVFLYQGKLNDNNNPANGNYVMQFKLFDALAGGTQIGATQTNAIVPVTNGIFSVSLDFGANAFTGANRFLEVAVRRNAGESFIILAPRTQILTAPYSIRSSSATTADVATNAQQLGGIAASEYVTTSSVGNSFIRNNTTLQTANFNIGGNGFVGGSLGVGTTSPQSRLSLFTPSPGYGLTHTDGLVTVGTYIGSGTGWLGTRSNHPLYFFTNNGGPQMVLNQLGNVGIGNFPSQTRLFVSGGPNWTSSNWQGSLGFQNAAALGWAANPGGQRFGIGQSTGGLYFFRTNSDFGNTQSPVNYDVAISDAGNVGIGTIKPDSKLTIVGTGENGFSLGTSGNVGFGGNAIQNRDRGGLVKAMLFVNGDGTIIRCYNGLSGSSSGNCGFRLFRVLAGQFRVDFNFQVTDRFCFVSALDNSREGAIAGFELSVDVNDEIWVYIRQSGAAYSDRPFMIVVF